MCDYGTDIDGWIHYGSGYGKFIGTALAGLQVLQGMTKLVFNQSFHW